MSSHYSQHHSSTEIHNEVNSISTISHDEELLAKDLDDRNKMLRVKQENKIKKERLQGGEKDAEIIELRNERVQLEKELTKKEEMVTTLLHKIGVMIELKLKGGGEDDNFPEFQAYSIGVTAGQIEEVKYALQDQLPIIDIKLDERNFGCEAKKAISFSARCLNPNGMTGPVVFAIHIFGPCETILTFTLEKTSKTTWFDFEFAMEGMKSGTYRLAVMNNVISKNRPAISEIIDDFIVRRRDIYFNFLCNPTPPVLPPPQYGDIYQFEEGYELINVKRSAGSVLVPVIRENSEHQFSFCWNLTHDERRSWTHGAGSGLFKAGSSITTVRPRFDPVYRPEAFTDYELILRPQDDGLLGPRQICVLRVENDIDVCIVGFMPNDIKHVGSFTGGSSVKLHIVRNNGASRLDLKWSSTLLTEVLKFLRSTNACLDTAAVSINVRSDRLYWNRQEGTVRFEPGQLSTHIRIQIPMAPELCMELFEIEINLESSRDPGVILDTENDVRALTVAYGDLTCELQPGFDSSGVPSSSSSSSDESCDD